MAYSVGLNQGALMQARMEEFLDESGRTGISQVELRVPKLVEALHHMTPKELRQRLGDNGVNVTALNSMDDFALVPDENLPLLRREAENAVHLCEAVQCDLVVAPVGRWFAEPPLSEEEVVHRSASRLRFIAEVLGPAGIRVGVEPIAFPRFTVWDLELSATIIENAGVGSAVLVADVYNLMAGASTPESMRRYGSRIGMIHVNDAPHRRFDQLDVMYTRLFPGEGILDPAEWVRAARDGGFEGPVSMEIFNKDIWEMSAAEAMDICADKSRIFGRTL